MANRDRKNYSGLLKQLQKEFRESQQNEVIEDTMEELTSSSSSNNVNIDVDLTSLIHSVNDLKELISLYDYCEEQLEIEQQITQDLLHAIEFSDSYKDRCKYSTQLHYNRQRRRVYKDTITVLKPLIDFISKEDSKKCLNKVSNLLGECRKVQERSNDRVYTPRILSELGEISNGKLR
jgi:hypothetical protein